MKLLLSLFSFLCLFQISTTATAQVSLNFNPIDSIQVCATEGFTFEITNSSNFDVNDTLFLFFDENDTLLINNLNLSIGTGNINQSNDTLFITGLSIIENSLTLSADLTITCNGYGINEYQEAINASLQLNQTEFTNFESSNFFIYTPRLIFLPGENHTYAIGQFGVPIERTFYITNTNSNIPFNGTILFCDTLNKPLDETAVIFDSVYFESNQASLESYEISDSIIRITLNINNLLQGDTIIIHDIIYLIDCASNNNNITRYELKYGCNATNLCYDENNFLTQHTSAAFDPNDKPIINVIDEDTHHEACFYDTVWRTYEYENTGIGNANGIAFRLWDRNIDQSFTKLDTSSIEIYINSISPANKIDPIIIPQLIQTVTERWKFNIDTIVTPNTLFFLRFKEITTCPDSYEDYFNSGVLLHNIDVEATLQHPCFPSVFNFYHIGGGAINHLYRLNKEFNNLHSQMADGESLWYETNHTNKITIGQGSNSRFANDITNSAIEVNLELETGLSIDDLDSIYISALINSIEYKIEPYTVEYGLNSNGFGNGDTIIAFFQIPDSMQYIDSSYSAFSSSHYLYRGTSFFNQFFSNCSLKFKLKAHCQYAPTDSRSSITEKSFFHIDTTCTDCKIPLSKVEDYTNINCPGCYLPGWNLTKAHISRINIGYADTNNNHYPDIFPLELANPNDVNLKRANIGDTLIFDIEGFISDGAPQPNGLTFSDLNFDFDEGQLVFKGDVSKIIFIGAQGTFTHNGITHVINIPATSAVVYPTGITLDMSASSLVNYGVSGFTSYNSSSSIDIQPLFKITGNYNDGLGSNPYVSVKAINIFYYMGGEPFMQPDVITDALTIPLDTLEIWSPQQSENLSYWCTAYESRFIGVGVDFKTWNPEFSKRGNQNADCEYGIKQYIHGFTGHQYQQNLGAGTGGYSNSLHTNYTNELRDFWNIDSVTYYFPKELIIDDIRFISSNPINSNPNSSTTWSNYNEMLIDYNYIYITDTSVTITKPSFENLLTEFSNGQNFGARDESIFYNLNITLKNKSCLIGDKIEMPKQSSKLWISNFPLSVNGDTLIELEYNYSSHSIGVGSNDSLDLPNPVFEINSLETNTINDQYEFAINFDFTVKHEQLYNNSTNLIDRTNNVSYNSFAIFVSPNNSFTNFYIPEILRNTTRDISTIPYYFSSIPEATQISGQINGSDVFELSYLGGSQYTHQSKNFDLNANYDCSNIPFGGQDSLYLIYGWNCFDYPTTLGEACFVDTLVLYIDIPPVGADINITTPSTVGICDTIPFSIEFDPTAGDIENLLVEVSRNDSPALDYYAGSSYIEYDGNNIPVNPVITDSNFVWILDTLSNVLNDFGETSPNATLHFQLLNGCDLVSDSISIYASATNFCGKLVREELTIWSPINITDLPQNDSLSLDITFSELSNCLDSILVNAILQNELNTTTNGVNQIEIVLPSNYSFSSGDTAIYTNGDTLSFNIDDIAANSTETISFYILNDSSTYCSDSIVSAQILSSIPYYCDTNLCYISNTNFEIQNFTISIPQNGISIDSINPIGLCNGSNELILNYSSISNGTLTILNQLTNNVVGQFSYLSNVSNGTSSVILSENTTELSFITNDCFCSDTINYTFECDSLNICDFDMSFEVNNYCIGDTITVTNPELNGIHIWNYSYFGMSQTGNTASFPAVNAGTYTIEHIFIADCGETDTLIQTFEVNAPTPTSIVLNGTNPFCSSDSVMLTIDNSSGYTNFHWNNGDSTETIWITDAGTYGVIVSDSNGCSQDCQAITLSSIESPSTNYDTLFICSNSDSVLLDAGNYGSYFWFNGSSSQTTWVVGEGEYEVTVCDSSNAGCCSTDTIIVWLEEIELIVNDTIVCENTTLTFTPENIYSGTYIWSNNQTGISAQYSDQGQHWVSFTNQYGCSVVDSFFLATEPLPNSSFQIQDTICATDSLTCLIPDFSDPSYSHEWLIVINGTSYHNYEEFPCFNFDNVGIVSLTHIVSNTCGSDSTTNLINVIETDFGSCITIIGQNPFCEGDSVLLTSNNNFTSIEWLNENGEIIGYGDTLVVYNSGVYSANAVDVNGCISTCICTELSMITANPFDISDTIICDGEPITFTLPNNEVGIWSTGNYSNSTEISNEGIYTVTTDNSTGCDYTDTFYVENSEFGNFNLSLQFKKNCFFKLKVVPNNPNYTYQWTHNGTLLSNSNIAFFDISTFYPFYFTPFFATFEVTITDENGCSTVESISQFLKPCKYISVFPNPFEDLFKIDYYVESGDDYLLDIMDSKGKSIYTKTLENNSGIFEVNFSDYSSGLYVVIIQVDGKMSQHQKIIKK